VQGISAFHDFVGELAYLLLIVEVFAGFQVCHLCPCGINVVDELYDATFVLMVKQLASNDFEGGKFCHGVILAIVILDKFVPCLDTILILQVCIEILVILVGDLIAPYNILESVWNWFAVILGGSFDTCFEVMKELLHMYSIRKECLMR